MTKIQKNEEAIIEAKKVYDIAEALAWQTYKETMAPEWAVYSKALEEASKVYKKASAKKGKSR